MEYICFVQQRSEICGLWRHVWVFPLIDHVKEPIKYVYKLSLLDISESL